MKQISLILFLSLTICSAEYPKEKMRAILDTGKQCMQELSISMDDNVIERVIYLKGPDRKDMSFLHCMMKKFNMLDDENKIVVDVVVDFLAPHHDAEKVRQKVESCAKQDDPIINEKLWKYVQCFEAKKSCDP